MSRRHGGLSGGQRPMEPPRALVGNAADEEQVEAAIETARDRQMSDDDHTLAILSSVSGRREYWRLLSHCGISHSTLSAIDATGRLDGLAMAAKEGRRNVGLWLQADLIRISPDLYLTMQREAMETRTNA